MATSNEINPEHLNIIDTSDPLIPREISESTADRVYEPVKYHWFYKRDNDGRISWEPFSKSDSDKLENIWTSGKKDTTVATDGGRFDVNILKRTRSAVFWSSPDSEVRRCSWFYKGNIDGKYVPYSEEISDKLEIEYKLAFQTNEWHHKVQLNCGESVMFHSPDILVHFPQSQSPDVWGNTPQTTTRPRVVKRGLDEFEIDEGEPVQVDHLLFLVHGIGSVCDLRFRKVEEVVDDFRSISLQLIQSHYKSSCERGLVNRVEVLPISWHSKLHSEDTGIDKKLKSITLESIPRLREYTNDTLLDILFYTSPIYCQTIVSAVGNEMNRLYDLFLKRNPSFKGGVSLGGHSLGSLILFDILCHQRPSDTDFSDEDDETVQPNLSVKPHPEARRMSKRISYMMSMIGTGQVQIHYPHLNFNPTNFFALGAPIGMFVTVRGLDSLGENFALPTCPSFFNIFHPYDPVAYRIESLINPEAASVRPVLIPHHKGRKRMHLELKETMVRVGADLKQKFWDSVKSTWNSFYQFTQYPKEGNQSLESEIDEITNPHVLLNKGKSRETSSVSSESDLEQDTDVSFGTLNKGRRIDYVLQEAPFEFFNEYLFALQSHVCYWESEDTMLLMLKEMYDSMNIKTDSQIPQQTMTIERSSGSSS